MDFPRQGRIEPNPATSRRNVDMMPDGQHVLGILNAGTVAGADQPTTLLAAASQVKSQNQGRPPADTDFTKTILVRVMLDMLRMDQAVSSQGARLTISKRPGQRTLRRPRRMASGASGSPWPRSACKAA